MHDPAIISRIEKLLELAARGGTEAEATTAFAKASQLMTKYGIERSQLQARNAQGRKLDIARRSLGRTWKTERPAHRPVRTVIWTCFKVQTIRHRYLDGSIGYSFLGVEEDLDFAVFAFNNLSDTFLRLLCQHFRDTGYTRQTPGVITGYLMGLCSGFIHAWREAQEKEIGQAGEAGQQYALVLVDKEALVAGALARDPNVKLPKKRDMKVNQHSYLEGWKHGQKITIARPLTA